MGQHFISSIWHTGLNISKWLNPQLDKLWVTVSDSFLISLMNILVSCCFSLVKISCFRMKAHLLFHCIRGNKGGAVVIALASHQCGPGSSSGIDAICGLSLLLVLSFAPRGFSLGAPVFPSPQNQLVQIPIRPGFRLMKNLLVELLPLNCYIFINMRCVIASYGES